MKFLITGGAGFIGCNLISMLLKDDANWVVCFDNFDDFYSRQQKESNINLFLNRKNFTLLEGDICNNDDLKKISDIDIIIHLAAKTGVRSSIDNALLYYQVNVCGTRNLLEFAVCRGVKQFIFASSSSVYGVNPNTPWDEKVLPMPISPYALSKLECEKMGLYYSNRYNLRFLALRLFSVFGPAQRPDLVVYIYFRSIINGIPISVFGNGLSCRDYSYIGDVIQGIMSAVKYDQSMFEIINLGRQQTISLNSLIKLIEEISEKKAIINYCPEQLGDVAITYASNLKARQLLNYIPKKKIKNGLMNFYNWYLNISPMIAILMLLSYTF